LIEELELDEKSNVRKTHFPFSNKDVTIYNLEVVIAVGYGVKSKRGILFRCRISLKTIFIKWDTAILIISEATPKLFRTIITNPNLFISLSWKL
jgi:hypothetical protein